jgi:hypothetical protein
MDAIPYGYSLLVSAKACSRVVCTCCWTKTVFARNSVDSIFVVPAWREEDETATEGLLPISQSMEQSTEREKGKREERKGKRSEKGREKK